MSPKPKVHVRQLGLVTYEAATALQQDLFQQTIDQKIHNRRNPDDQTPTQHNLLFLEHPPVYTLGKSGDKNNLLVNNTTLQEKGASFFKTNRGGDITFHGPGQLVGYPILDLDCFFTDIHMYLRFLEECIIATLASLIRHNLITRDFLNTPLVSEIFTVIVFSSNCTHLL